MSQFTRRNFIRLAGGAAAAAGVGFPYVASAKKHMKGRVVVIGGGAGGAVAAKYIKRGDAGLDVVLLEPKKEYHTCFMSNEVLGGERTLDSIRFTYDGLGKRDIRVVHDAAKTVDTSAKKVTTAGGKTFEYDRLVMAPGIGFKWGAIEGYDEAAAEKMPHAWQAGAQTALLRKQLEAMKDGGLVLIAPPPNPFRCPPGPYERAAQIAHYLKHHKPKSKILVVDAKDKFSKQGLFMAGWKEHYGDMIEWVKSADTNGGIKRVEPGAMRLHTDFDKYSPDVANVIPAQKAADIAHAAGLTDDSGWCPVHLDTFESKIAKDVHVIGDASIATGLPKSGYAANSEAKVAAAAIVASLRGDSAPVPSYVNTCYSVITPEHGISVAMVYRLNDEKSKIGGVKGAGGLSPKDASAEMRKREVAYAHSWFKNITEDMFG